MSDETTQTESNPYQGFKFDPMTGKSLDSNANPSTEQEPERDLEKDFTHFVHLADGRVLKAFGGYTTHYDSDEYGDRGVQVIGVYSRYGN
jgi:hypothetical protein